jgi:hypothetical protein
MGMFDDAWRESVKGKEDIEEEIFDDEYLAKIKETIRTSDGDFCTVSLQDIEEIKTILKHLINRVDKITGMM